MPSKFIDKIKQYCRCMCVLQCCVTVTEDFDQKFKIHGEDSTKTTPPQGATPPEGATPKIEVTEKEVNKIWDKYILKKATDQSQ